MTPAFRSSALRTFPSDRDVSISNVLFHERAGLQVPSKLRYSCALVGGKMDITPETPLRRSLETYYAPVGDQGVILNINANRYHSLNTVGARIWELLETPQTAGELCSHLLEEFEVDGATRGA